MGGLAVAMGADLRRLILFVCTREPVGQEMEISAPEERAAVLVLTQREVLLLGIRETGPGQTKEGRGERTPFLKTRIGFLAEVGVALDHTREPEREMAVREVLRPGMRPLREGPTTERRAEDLVGTPLTALGPLVGPAAAPAAMPWG